MKKIFKYILCFLICCSIIGGYLYYEFVYRANTEPGYSEAITSTRPVYTFDQFKSGLKQYTILYQAAIQVNEQEIADGTYVIPGLISTRTLTSSRSRRITICTSMTPQGIAVTKDYIFVSAYCHTQSHNSVLYMIDKRSHEFIKEIVLPGKPHVGSLAYDTRFDNLWICGRKNDYAQANAISIEALEAYSFDDAHKPISYLHHNNVLEIKRSSFMTYNNGYIYIGYFNTRKNGVILKYQVDDDGDIHKAKFQYKGMDGESYVSTSSMSIPKTAQGMAFYYDKLFMSHSLGVMPSTLRMFAAEEESNRYAASDAMAAFRLPSMMEQIYIDGNDLYFIFESGAYAFRNLPVFGADRIIRVDISELRNMTR